MIKAYHSTGTQKALDEVQREGALLPGIYRLSEEAIRATCGKDAETFDRRYGPNPVALRALRQLIDEFVADHADLLKETAGRTALRCVDILAGDADRIFLSAYQWTLTQDVEKRSFPKTGLVFEALELVQKGAAVRPQDLYGDFTWALETQFKKSYASPERARDSIANELAAIIEDGSLYGDEAVQYLLKGQKDDQIAYQLEHEDIEVVWDGTLPVEWAIEEWRNGVASKISVHR